MSKTGQILKSKTFAVQKKVCHPLSLGPVACIVRGNKSFKQQNNFFAQFKTKIKEQLCI